MNPRRPSVALAIADTESYVLANNALQACVNRFVFDRVLVLTDAPQHWPQYQAHAVAKMQGIEDYNRLVLETLPTLVTEDFCLVIQFDGFILHPEAFSEAFYAYDYIGAVWPDYPYFRVGNGGFSWRSRKLMQAVAELAPMRRPGEAEDLFIGRAMRVLLEERYGCVSAPEPVARQFSYEIVPQAGAAFGFHGIFNLPLVYRDNLAFLVQNLPPRILQTRLPFLRYGVQQLPAAQQLVFENLIRDTL